MAKNASNVVKIKALGGDRAANLEGIADEIERIGGLLMFDGNPSERRKVQGYAEQLRIIANELREGKKVERGDFPPHDPIGELD